MVKCYYNHCMCYPCHLRLDRLHTRYKLFCVTEQRDGCKCLVPPVKINRQDSYNISYKAIFPDYSV